MPGSVLGFDVPSVSKIVEMSGVQKKSLVFDLVMSTEAALVKAFCPKGE